jgi:hypothetical protein
MSNPPSLEVHAKLIELIAARSREDRYAALLSQPRTSAAHTLIYQVFAWLRDPHPARPARGGRRWAFGLSKSPTATGCMNQRAVWDCWPQFCLEKLLGLIIRHLAQLSSIRRRQVTEFLWTGH